jgi:cytochrome c oxidase cbb3-type subunit 3
MTFANASATVTTGTALGRSVFWSPRLLVCLFLLAGCDLPGRPDPAHRPKKSEEIVDFDALYQKNCAGCHGADGKLGPGPPLNDPLFVDLVPEAVIEEVISTGRPGTPMPAFEQFWGGPLTARQVEVLAAGIKSNWGSRSPDRAKAPPYLAPDTETGSLEAGRQVFSRACAGCHGTHGQGGEHGGRRIGAINEPAFLELISDQALRRYVITGRPDLGMPNYAGREGRPAAFQPLTSQEVADLVTLLASWRHTRSLKD